MQIVDSYLQKRIVIVWLVGEIDRFIVLHAFEVKVVPTFFSNLVDKHT